jgi:hypothetical protein
MQDSRSVFITAILSPAEGFNGTDFVYLYTHLFIQFFSIPSEPVRLDPVAGVPGRNHS